MSSTKVAVITGANRGIGLAICRSLASRPTSAPLVLYAVSRSGTPLDIPSAAPGVSLKYHRLDLRSEESARALAKTLQHEHGGCNVLVNNAGLYHYTLEKGREKEMREEMLGVNYRGTLMVCRTLIPIMHPGSRIVNVSSQSGNLQQFGAQLQARFRDPQNTLADIDILAGEYESASMTETATQRGWAQKPYFVSKALETAMTIALAREHPSLQINACCPGWVSSDLGNQAGRAPKTLEEGARIPIRVGFGDIGDLTGRYWANAEIWGTGEGEVQPF